MSSQRTGEPAATVLKSFGFEDSECWRVGKRPTSELESVERRPDDAIGHGSEPRDDRCGDCRGGLSGKTPQRLRPWTLTRAIVARWGPGVSALAARRLWRERRPVSLEDGARGPRRVRHDPCQRRLGMVKGSGARVWLPQRHPGNTPTEGREESQHGLAQNPMRRQESPRSRRSGRRRGPDCVCMLCPSIR